MNFFGQLTFFCPLLVLHLARVNQNLNCIAFCWRHPDPNNPGSYGSRFGVRSSNASSSSIGCGMNSRNLPKPMDEEEDEVAEADDLDDATSRTDIQIEQDPRELAAEVANQRLSRNSSESSINTMTDQKVSLNCHRNAVYSGVGSKRSSLRQCFRYFNVFNVCFNTKLKYLLLILFVVYVCANFSLVVLKFDFELPVIDLIPKQSYLRKHMVNHLQLFNLGPIIVFSFLKPMHYWNHTTFNRIRLLLNDAKDLHGLDPIFEMNWLQDTFLNAVQKGVFEKNCKNRPLKFHCFYEAFKVCFKMFSNFHLKT